MSLGKVFIVILLAGAVCSCLEKKTSFSTSNKSSKAEKYLSKAEPKQIDHKLNIDLDDKIVLLGYDLKKDTAKPGEVVEVTWYWQSKKATGPGWRLFTHVVDAKGESRMNRDKVGTIRQFFQPEHWEPNMVIRDVQVIKIPAKWNSDAMELRVGLWKGTKRMRAKGPRVDSEGRIRGARINTKYLEPVLTEIPRAVATPVIDGKFENEKTWSNAIELEPFSQTITGKKASRNTLVRLMWDDANLYVAMQAEDDHLKSKYTKHDDELWHEDAFEIFLDPKADKKDYYELQVNPAGVVFDSHLPKYRKNQNEWTSKMIVKVVTQGKLNKDKSPDKGWQAELAIPFSSLSKGGGIPPKPGDRWRANFFRIDVTKEKPLYSAWSPPMRGDFHALDMFGEIVFKAAVPKEDSSKESKGAKSLETDKKVDDTQKEQAKSASAEKKAPVRKRSNRKAPEQD